MRNKKKISSSIRQANRIVSKIIGWVKKKYGSVLCNYNDLQKRTFKTDTSEQRERSKKIKWNIITTNDIRLEYLSSVALSRFLLKIEINTFKTRQ